MLRIRRNCRLCTERCSGSGAAPASGTARQPRQIRLPDVLAGLQLSRGGHQSQIQQPVGDRIEVSREGGDLFTELFGGRTC